MPKFREVEIDEPVAHSDRRFGSLENLLCKNSKSLKFSNKTIQLRDSLMNCCADSIVIWFLFDGCCPVQNCYAIQKCFPIVMPFNSVFCPHVIQVNWWNLYCYAIQQCFLSTCKLSPASSTIFDKNVIL